MFPSGYTSDAERLEDQVSQVVNAVAGGLIVARTKWDKLVKISFFLHRSQKLEALKELLGKEPPLPNGSLIEFGFVDGYAGDKSLLEVEATALLSGNEPR